MITCKFCHKLTAQQWGEPCPYCRIKEAEAEIEELKEINNALKKEYIKPVMLAQEARIKELKKEIERYKNLDCSTCGDPQYQCKPLREHALTIKELEENYQISMREGAKLLEENQRLREALEQILKLKGLVPAMVNAKKIARKALQDKGDRLVPHK